MGIMRYRGADGIVREVVALKGDKGEPGGGGGGDASQITYDGSEQYIQASTVEEALHATSEHIIGLQMDVSAKASAEHEHDSGDVRYTMPDYGINRVNEALDHLFNQAGNVANALKGSATGEIVAVSDASPLERDIAVTVKRKNLFNKWNMKHGTETSKYAPVLLEDGRIYVPQTAMNSDKTLKELAPEIEVGKTYMLTFTTTGESTHIYLGTSKATWVSGRTRTIVETDLDSNIYFYTFSGDKAGDCAYITDFQIEEGTTATAYAPYIDDLSSISLLKYGTNLFDTTQPRIRAYLDNTLMLFSDDSWSVAIPCEPNKTYYVCHANESNAIFRICYIKQTPLELEEFIANGGEIKWQTYATQRKTTEKHLTITTGDEATFIIVQISSAQALNTISTLHCSDFITEYEPNTNGAVGGVTLDYPTTVLSTDTEGALVDVQYNRDINKAFETLVQAIISLGGNV